MDSEIRQAILGIYKEAEKEIAQLGPVCVASGRCCRFKDYGHTLFLSNLEAELLMEQAPPFQKPVDGNFCPFQVEKLCTAREQRPLGCRIFFCDPNYQEKSHDLTEKYLRRIKDLAQHYKLPWLYAPLHHFLNQQSSEP